MPTKPFDFGRMSTRPLGGRPSLVSIRDFAKLPEPGASATELLDSLPRFLAAERLRSLVAAIAAARRADRGVVLGLGGHVVKTGCGPVIVDLIERGVVTGVAMPGSTAIHDYEIAAAGVTSEDVAEGLDRGAYGTTEETGRFFAGAAEEGARGIGLGRALGERIREAKLEHRSLSILAAAARKDVPATVHLAIGTDTVHLHPLARGADLGESTHLDFRIFTTVVSGLDHGVYLNVGSAVVLPEVFLKAVTAARNAGMMIEGLFTANLDMLRHYRPLTNVVRRPAEQGVDISAHHEIILPLLRLLLLERLAGEEG